MACRNNLLYTVVLLTLCGIVYGQTGNCTQVSTCKCIFDDGTVLDLRPLSREDGQPFFKNIEAKDKDTYFWNPCFPFSYIPERNESECTNVAVCMERIGFPQSLVYDLGTQDTAKFSTNASGTVYLTYTTDKGDYDRVTTIELRCSTTLKSDFLFADVEQDISNRTTAYHLILLSKYACGLAPTLAPPLPPPDNGLGGGAIFAIVFFTLIGSYLLFGTLFQFASGKRGIRMFPNHDFWCMTVPGLCKRSGEKMSSGDKGAKYDSI